MNGDKIFFLLLLYIIQVLAVVLTPLHVNHESYIHEQEEAESSLDRDMNSILYKSVNKYFCAATDVDGLNESGANNFYGRKYAVIRIKVTNSHLIVYGNKAWNFPLQDVNVTLSYPSANITAARDESDIYIITGFRVHLYINGAYSRGFISDGGIFQESITLTFTSSNITTMWYQFWLYGVPKIWNSNPEASTFYYNMC